MSVNDLFIKGNRLFLEKNFFGAIDVYKEIWIKFPKNKRLEDEIADIQANGEDSKFVNEGEDYQEAINDRQSDILTEKKKHEEADNSPANYGSPLNDDREIPQWKKEDV